MKRCLKFFTCLAILLPFLAGDLVEATENTNVELILHKRIYRDIRAPIEAEPFYTGDGLVITEGDYQGNQAAEELMEKTSPLNGANFIVYEVTDFYHKELAKENLDIVQDVTNWSPREISKLVAANNFTALTNGQITTKTDQELGGGIARIMLPRKNQGRDAAYLIVESGLEPDKALNVDLEQRSSPMLLVLPQHHPLKGDELTQIHLYPKNIGYVRDPYFFKYSKTQDKEVPLAGVVFAFYQLGENGEKLYLDSSPISDLKNKWRISADPLNDENVNKFVSDETGLVSMPSNFFASGTYYFEELKTVAGHQITADDKKIEVIIPDSWRDDQGNFRYVTVNGQKMAEEYSGVVPESAKETATPRVYNYLTEKQGTPTQSTTSQPKWGQLPRTGEAKAMISLVGIIIILFSLKLIRRRSN